MTKTELLDAIRRERALLDAAVARVGEVRMTEPSLEGGRSVKDVLAHVCGWERIAVAVVRKDEPVPAPPPAEEPNPTTDIINERMYESNRDRPLADILEDGRRSYEEVVALVESLDDEALGRVVGGAGDGPEVGRIIGGNSHGHYAEHIEQINRWLDGR